MNTMTKLIATLALLSVACFAQTALTSTTLSSAVTINQNTFVVASASGITGTGNANAVTTMLYVDRELVRVLSVSSTTITVQRAVTQTGSIQSAHVSGAKVWIGPPAGFSQNRAVTGASTPITDGGACVRTALLYVPVVDVTTGNMFDCLGVTTAGRFARTSSPGTPFLGSTVTPASSITPTGPIFATTSGSTTIATIVVPAGWSAGMCLQVIPGGTGATTSSGGNIGLTTSALVVGRVMFFCYDGTSWWPSYVS